MLHYFTCEKVVIASKKMSQKEGVVLFVHGDGPRRAERIAGPIAGRVDDLGDRLHRRRTSIKHPQ